MINKIKLPQNIKSVMQIILDNNFECYVVGGAIRDSLLNKKVKDYDLTSNALPDDIINIFEDIEEYRVIELGKNFGTIGVFDGVETIEVTTYRKECDYKDNRHPSAVEFIGDLKTSLQRRDFTINTLCCDIDGNILDYFDEIDDLKNKIIKCVGNPNDRFNEDGLRILRAIRFACVLDFDIDLETEKSINQNYKLLDNIAKERIQSELNKILCCENWWIFFIVFQKISLYIFGTEILQIPYKDITGKVLNCEDIDIKLGFLFNFIHCDQVKIILNSLKYENKIINNVINIRKYYGYLYNSTIFKKEKSSVIIKNALRNYDKHIVLKALILIELQIPLLSLNNFGEQLEMDNITLFISLYKALDKIISNNECYNLSQLKINGHDLLDLGFEGKIIKTILNKVLDEIINEKLTNEKDIIIKYVKDNFVFKVDSFFDM